MVENDKEATTMAIVDTIDESSSDDTVTVGGREVSATGDDGNMAMWLVLLIVSGAGLEFGIRRRLVG